jgi:hypothetical protein
MEDVQVSMRLREVGRGRYCVLYCSDSALLNVMKEVVIKLLQDHGKIRISRPPH